MYFMRTYAAGLSGDYNSILTHITTHISSANHPDMAQMILRWWASWWYGWMKMAWWKSKTYHGRHWCIYMQNHIKKMWHITITSVGCVCPIENWTKSLTHLNVLYHDAMTQYMIFPQKTNNLLRLMWIVVIGKWIKKKRHKKDWNYSPVT